MAYETWIAPLAQLPRFEEGLDAEAFAPLLLAVLHAVEAEIGAAGYNVMIQTSPRGAEAVWHWRIEIVPRTSSLAGFELATGLFVNVVSPERAAERLRRRIRLHGEEQSDGDRASLPIE